MTGSQHRPHGWRHLFRRSHASEGRLVPRDPIGDQNGANGSVVVQEQTGIPSPTLNPDVARSYSPTLWDEIYDSFNASIASPDLRDIAKSFRQQSRSPPARFTEIPAGDPENSREWHMCRQIIQSAEAKKNGNNSGAGPLKRKIRDAYNEITVWVQKFVSLGDIISQVDPLHVGLPWAGVRAILIGSTLHST